MILKNHIYLIVLLILLIYNKFIRIINVAYVLLKFEFEF